MNDYVEGVELQLIMGVAVGAGQYVDYDELRDFADGDNARPGYRAHLRTFLKDYDTRLTTESRQNLFETAVLMGQLAKLLAGKGKEIKKNDLVKAHNIVSNQNLNPIYCGASNTPPQPFCT